MEELQIIQSKIYEIRGERVMLDRDIAALYNVETKVLNQAVKRNIKRFPEDFMFQLSKTEFQIWKSQIVTSNSDKRISPAAPLALYSQMRGDSTCHTENSSQFVMTSRKRVWNIYKTNLKTVL